jgi:hypothetical protein
MKVVFAIRDFGDTIALVVLHFALVVVSVLWVIYVLDEIKLQNKSTIRYMYLRSATLLTSIVFLICYIISWTPDATMEECMVQGVFLSSTFMLSRMFLHVFYLFRYRDLVKSLGGLKKWVFVVVSVGILIEALLGVMMLFFLQINEADLKNGCDPSPDETGTAIAAVFYITDFLVDLVLLRMYIRPIQNTSKSTGAIDDGERQKTLQAVISRSKWTCVVIAVSTLLVLIGYAVYDLPWMNHATDICMGVTTLTISVALLYTHNRFALLYIDPVLTCWRKIQVVKKVPQRADSTNAELTSDAGGAAVSKNEPSPNAAPAITTAPDTAKI